MKKQRRNTVGFKRINLSLCTKEGQDAYKWLVENQNVSHLVEEFLITMEGQLKRLLKLQEGGFINDEADFREMAIRILGGLE